MNVFWRVFALEWRVLRRERAFWGTLVFFSAFLILAALSSDRFISEQTRSMEGIEEEETRRLENARTRLEALQGSTEALSGNDVRDPVWMGETGAARAAILPPAALSTVAVGVRDITPQILRVSSQVDQSGEMLTESAMRGPSIMGAGALDPAFLFVVLFPLVLIALSYEILSGERERGTLAMLVSQPVSQTQLVLGKAAARLVLLLALTATAALLGLQLAGQDWSAPGLGTSLVLFLGVLMGWTAFWFALAIWVNATSASSARNALTLVGFWLALVVLVPGLVQVSVETFAPSGSPLERLHEVRETVEEVESRLNAIEGRHDVDPTAEGYAKGRLATQDELLEKLAPLLERHRLEQESRTSLLGWVQFLSPAIAMQRGLEDIAGSGTERYQRFVVQTDQYRESFRTFFAERIRAEQQMQASDISTIPTLVFEEEEGGAIWGRGLTVIGYLLLLSALCVAAALPNLRNIGRLTR